MKKLIGIAAMLCIVACNSPENKSESSVDSSTNVNNSATENGVTNSPPGGSTDSNQGLSVDTTHRDSLK